MYKSVMQLQDINIFNPDLEKVDKYINRLFKQLKDYGYQIPKSNSRKNNVKKLILCDNKSFLKDFEATCIINQLNRIVNQIEYLNEIEYEKGKLTLIAAPIGIVYDIEQLSKFAYDKNIIATFLEELEWDTKIRCLSGMTGIESYRIKDYKITNKELSLIKKESKAISKKTYTIDYKDLGKISDLATDATIKNSDLVFAYRMRRITKNKNKIIEELKLFAEKNDKPVVLIYHPSHNTIHNICKTSLKELNLDNIDFIYGMLPGIEGFIEL